MGACFEMGSQCVKGQSLHTMLIISRGWKCWIASHEYCKDIHGNMHLWVWNVNACFKGGKILFFIRVSTTNYQKDHKNNLFIYTLQTIIYLLQSWSFWPANLANTRGWQELFPSSFPPYSSKYKCSLSEKLLVPLGDHDWEGKDLKHFSLGGVFCVFWTRWIF